ncbi:MAG: phytoene/squalene synthase family protein, partial [Dongiaceae bacterium]
LFAPADRREALFALYAFNLELARARESVSQPTLGLIRLQWWRDGLDAIYRGAPPRHAVAAGLAEAVTRHGLSRRHFDRLIDARETDMSDSPPPDLAALIDYAEGTSSSLVSLALEALGGGNAAAAEAGRRVGIAWALTGLLRAVPFHASARRLYLPQDLIERTGLQPDALFALRPSAELAASVAEIARVAREHLAAGRAAGRGLPRRLVPALLPATLAELYLARLERAGHDVFDRRVQQAPAGRAWRLAARAWRGRF